MKTFALGSIPNTSKSAYMFPDESGLGKSMLARALKEGFCVNDLLINPISTPLLFADVRQLSMVAGHGLSVFAQQYA